MEILLFFAFISGLVTILAPCIWPLLPIVLSSSLAGGKPKSLGITLGIMVSFSVFILSISYLVKLFGLDPNIIRLFAVIVLVIMGLSMIVPLISRILEGILSRFSGRFGQSFQKRSGFGGGFITGCSLGIVWTPCTGPILATIATLAATTNLNTGIILVTIVYVMGLGIPLFFFSYGGGRLVARTRFVSGFTGRIQQVFGVLLLLTALAIYTNYDKVLQVKLLDSFPSYTQFLIGLESNPAVKKQLNILKGNKEKTDEMIGKPFDMTDSNGLPNLGKAPEFVGINNWLNSKPLTMSELRGKVVLIDFWTYTCINCIRTLPHVTGWYNKYKDQGFVVVGVHTPEFEFEKDTKNVENAIKQYKIDYPVAQDNDYATWNAYSNQYWPAKYLIDANGVIRYIHFGEGNYDETEKAIQDLLKEAGKNVSTSLQEMEDQTPRSQNSPETYLGSERMQYLTPNGKVEVGSYRFSLPKNIPINHFSLGGEWDVMSEYSSSRKDSILEYNFQASKVFLVMRPGDDKPKQVKVYLDGKLVTTGSGKDVTDGSITVDSDRLYELIDLTTPENHTLRLEFQNAGTEVFAFTFG
ncbi:MAG: Redoxin protein [uncultured bacterium]|nr:MAG: Redoxin protein [uncultured bacterium]